MTLSAEDVQIIGTELAVRWSDAAETFLSLEALRKNCPCAACCGEPDVTGNVLKPTVRHQANSFELVSIQPVGGYALQPRWADGHSSGIYSFQYLRRLGDATLGTTASS